MGYTDEGLRKKLTNIKESGIEIQEMQTYGGGTSLKSKICYEEVRYTKISIYANNFTTLMS